MSSEPAAPKRPPLNPWLKLALDFGPLALFFAAYSRWDLFVATGTIMAAVVVSLVVTFVYERRVPLMPLVTAVLVIALGGLTLWLDNDLFIKLKLTIVNGLFGLVLLGGLVLRKPLVKKLFGETVALTDEGWALMTRAWIGYFFAVALLNELVWRNASTDTWVKFKTFAIPAVTLGFFLLLSPWLARHAQAEEE